MVLFVVVVVVVLRSVVVARPLVDVPKGSTIEPATLDGVEDDSRCCSAIFLPVDYYLLSSLMLLLS